MLDSEGFLQQTQYSYTGILTVFRQITVITKGAAALRKKFKNAAAS